MWLSEQGAPPALRGDSALPSRPQPLPPVAAQSFQQEMSSSSRLSQGRRAWLPFPEVLQAERDLSTTLGTRGRPGHLGCWVG